MLLNNYHPSFSSFICCTVICIIYFSTQASCDTLVDNQQQLDLTSNFDYDEEANAGFFYRFVLGTLRAVCVFTAGTLVVLLVHRSLFDDDDPLCGFGQPEMMGSFWLIDHEQLAAETAAELAYIKSRKRARG